MRTIIALSFAAAAAWSVAALAAPPASRLPQGTGLDDAGMAAWYAGNLCQASTSTVQSYRTKVDALSPGGSGTPDFHEGERQALSIVNQIRAEGGDTSELSQRVCPRSLSLIERTMALP
ncbi:hypothetical protein [Luteibacter sp. 329MFSha]|uniref:hypothetical protein n=1 Tax=Luteibacter sp. 329MFSha TaxID=1798239 RepID=UPI0008C27A1D|nr:hypothetical protein [Luteibacter sp. 329MFSha]SEV85214.1 hypothetical protein SAMN04515660_0283 [Luteibacter sp. 329MFSha]